MGESSRVEFSAPKVVALIAILMVFREGVTFFWAGSAIGDGELIAIGLLEALLMAGILLIALVATLVDLKVEILKKLYHWVVLLLIGILVLIIELWAYDFDGEVAVLTCGLLGSMLVITAALCELIASKKDVPTSTIVVLMGILWVLIESIGIFYYVSEYIPDIPPFADLRAQQIYHGILGIIIVIYMLFIMQNKVKVKYVKLPYDWWTVLILGFIALFWVMPYPATLAMGFTGVIILPVGGMLLMVGFIVKVKE
ncbi:MAG: hypothetical protein ACFFAS_00790 [Promethearchaeota archaeon]